MTYAVVVDWYGPYGSVKEANAAIREWGFGEVLYMAAGTVGRQSVPKLQYVGITKGFERRMNTRHKVRTTIADEGLSIYIGEVSSQAVSGRKASHHHKGFTIPVNLAESALAFFLQLPLNSDKRCSRPRDSVVLLNRWWKTDIDTRSRRRTRKPSRTSAGNCSSSVSGSDGRSSQSLAMKASRGPRDVTSAPATTG